MSLVVVDEQVCFVPRSYVQVLAQTFENIRFLFSIMRVDLLYRRSVYTRESIQISEGLSYGVALFEYFTVVLAEDLPSFQDGDKNEALCSSRSC